MVSLGQDEPQADRVEAALAGTAELVRGRPHECAVRLLGPRELESGGARALRMHRLRSPGIPAIAILASELTGSLVRDCYREGAQDVLALDEVASNLPLAIRRALERVASGQGHEDEAQRMATELGKRARDLEAALEQVRAAYDQTLGALVNALDCKERETALHSQRVAFYSILIGLRLGLEPSDLETLYRGALLHDIGKIGTPDAVLLKPGSFTDEEWEIMKEHVQIGGDILAGIAFLRDASVVPHAHHEAWDGSGYPAGLKGQGIPLYARIFAVVDSYDAIRSKRPYKPAKPHGEALDLLGQAAGKRLDPSIVECFVAEPESTWLRIEQDLGRDLTFDSALHTCQQADSA